MTMTTVPIDQCRRMIESKHPFTLIDVRTPAEFARAHAVGARLMPFDTLDPAAVAAARPTPEEPIYVICQSGARSAKAYERLQDFGMANVYSVEGGTDAWARAGLPIDRGAGKVISLERQVRIAAGAIILVGSLLAWRIHPAFLAIPAAVGAGLVFAGVTNFCGMALLLAKMPWNR